MQLRTKQHLGLWMVAMGTVFLVDPIVGLRDFLPDCIGYLLLCIGISRVSDLSDRIAEAREGFRRMVWVSLGVLFADFYIHSILLATDAPMNTYEAPTLVLIGSLVLFILKCYFLIPAYRNLFLGLDALAEHGGGTGILVQRRGRSRGERMAVAGKHFVILQSLLLLLPELSVLTTFEFEMEKLAFDWYAYIGLFRTVCGLVAFAVGVVWLTRSFSFWRAVVTDRPWIKALEERYRSEILPDVYRIEMRRYRFAFALLALGAVFTMTLRIDFLDIFPGVFFSILLALGTVLLWQQLSARRTILILCGVLLFVERTQNAVFDWFTERHGAPEASLYLSSAFSDYLIVRFCIFMEALITLALCWALLLGLLGLARKQACVSYGGAEDVSKASLDATRRLHRRFARRTYITGIFFTLAMLAEAVWAVLNVYIPAWWWVPFLLQLSAVIAFVAHLYFLLDELEDRLSTVKAYNYHASAHTDAVIPNDKKENSKNAEQPEQSEQESEQSESEQSEPEQSEQESEQSEQKSAEQGSAKQEPRESL